MTISGPAVQNTAQPQRQFAAFSLSNRLTAAMAERNLYYGWVVAGSTFLVMLATAGAMGAPGVIIQPLEKEFGWSTAQISVALDGPLTVRSGGLAHHGLVVRNLGASDVLIGTTGELIAEVVDPASAAVVGGYAGAVRLMLTTFTVAPGAAQLHSLAYNL